MIVFSFVTTIIFGFAASCYGMAYIFGLNGFQGTCIAVIFYAIPDVLFKCFIEKEIRDQHWEDIVKAHWTLCFLFGIGVTFCFPDIWIGILDHGPDNSIVLFQIIFAACLVNPLVALFIVINNVNLPSGSAPYYKKMLRRVPKLVQMPNPPKILQPVISPVLDDENMTAIFDFNAERFKSEKK